MRVVWAREAARQKDEIWNFLAAHDVRYAERVERRLEARGATLAFAPYQGRPLDRLGVRQLSLPDIQFVMIYRIEEETVRILNIWGTAQDRRQ